MRPLIVEDARHQAPWSALKVTEDVDIGSYIGVPLVLSNGEVFGTLCAIDPEAHGFRPEDQQLMELLARLLAYQIERDELMRTKETQAAERLRLQEARAQLGAIVESTDDAILAKLLDGTIAAWNPGAERLYGYTAAEAVGQPISLIVPEDRPDEVPAILERIGRGERLDHIETVRRRKDGSLVDVSLTVSPLRDETGRITGASAIARDITERKRSERLLAERSGQMRAFLDATGEAIAMVAPDRRFLLANQRLGELFGVDAASLVGTHFGALATRVQETFADPEGFLALVSGSASDPERVFTELVAQRSPEPRELELFSTAVRGDDGVHLGRLYTFRDVTHEREVDRMKSQFVSLASHELRTPLTSIKGYLELVIEGESGPVNEQQREFLEVVQRSADRLIAIVNDILDLSRIEAGRVELHVESVALEGVISQAVATLRPLIDTKRQTLEVRVDAALPQVRADPARLSQVLTNLLSNAHKYTPEGGRICVETSRSEHHARVDVRDNGIGLSPSELGQLFGRFYRARNPKMGAVGGTGLGLAITKSLVEMQGGEITVTSERDKGATFSFTVPLAAGA